MRRVLVTGGSGFIGSHVVDVLAREGYAPRIYDLRPSPHHPNGSVDTAIGDLLDTDALRRATEGCDAIVHLAAAADVGIVAEDPEAAEQTNARGTMAVLEAARAAGCRVVYGSTIWVYSEAGSGVLDEEAALGLPSHLYTATKLAGEMYCASYAELFGVEYTILRFGIPYGPRARPAAVIPSFVAKAMAGEPLTIAGDGMQSRRFVYVEDLAEGIVKAIVPEAANRVYNLASDDTVTIKELAEIVRETTREVEIVHTPGRTGDFDGAQISNVRAAEELGWRARTPITEGVRRYVEWVREPAADVARSPVPKPSRRRVLERVPAGVGVTALACAFGMLIPYLLASRTDDFGSDQMRTIVITTLVAMLASLAALPRAGGRALWTGAAAAWLFASYIALLILPWTRHALDLGRPHAGTLLLAAIGTVVAVSTVSAVERLRAPETSPDQAA